MLPPDLDGWCDHHNRSEWIRQAIVEKFEQGDQNLAS